MYRKHLVSVMDLKNFPGDATPELIKEKIGDSINYHLLLEALLVERCNETAGSFETNFKKFMAAPEEPKMPCNQDPLAQHDCFGTGCAEYDLCDRTKKKSPAIEYGDIRPETVGLAMRSLQQEANEKCRKKEGNSGAVSGSFGEVKKPPTAEPKSPNLVSNPII